MRNLLWFDAFAAMASGITVLILKGFLAGLTGLPLGLLGTMAWVSLGYSAFSLYLARRNPDAKTLIAILIIANSAYASACLLILILLFRTVNAWGVAYLISESGVVAVLAAVERNRMRARFGTR